MRQARTAPRMDACWSSGSRRAFSASASVTRYAPAAKHGDRTAAGGDRRKLFQRKPMPFRRRNNERIPHSLLFHNGRIPVQLFCGMRYAFFPYLPFALIQGDLCRGRARVNYKNLFHFLLSARKGRNPPALFFFSFFRAFPDREGFPYSRSCAAHSRSSPDCC